MCVQVQEKEDTFKQTRIDALFGAARVSCRCCLLLLPPVVASVCEYLVVIAKAATMLRPPTSCLSTRIHPSIHPPPCLQAKQRTHLALGDDEQQQQQQGTRGAAAAVGDLEDWGAPAAARAGVSGASPVGIATSLDPERAGAGGAAAAGARRGENAADAANQQAAEADAEMPDRWVSVGWVGGVACTDAGWCWELRHCVPSCFLAARVAFSPVPSQPKSSAPILCPTPASTTHPLSPRRLTDYHGWLAAKKAQWRRSREARKRKRADVAADPSGRQARQRTGSGGVRADVGAMFQQQAAAATAAHWQIVSIAPTPELGALS